MSNGQDDATSWTLVKLCFAMQGQAGSSQADQVLNVLLLLSFSLWDADFFRGSFSLTSSVSESSPDSSVPVSSLSHSPAANMSITSWCTSTHPANTWSHHDT